MTSQPDREQQFIDNVIRSLDEAAEDLDASALSRLTQARNKAMEAGSKSRLQGMIWPVGGLIATAVLLLLLSPVFEHKHNKPQPVIEAPLMADIEVISDRLGLEFYRDLYFYYWLSMEDKHAK